MSVFTKVLESWNASCDYLKGLIDKTNTQIADIYNRCSGGKNLIDYTKIPSSFILNTLNFTNNNDGTFTLNGTRPSSSLADASFLYKTTLSKGTYTLSTNDDFIGLRIGKDDGTNIGSFITNMSRTFTLEEDTTIVISMTSIAHTASISYTDKIIEVMLRRTYIEDSSFVPYIPTNAELQSSFSILNVDNSKRCWYSRIISDTAFDSSFSFKLSQNAIPDGKRIPVRIIFTTQYAMTPIEILFSVNSTNVSPFTIAMLHGGIESGSVLKVAIYSKTVADEKTTYYTVKILNKTQLYGMAYIEYPCVNNKLMFTVSYSSTQITETTEGARKINIYAPTYSLMS